MPHPTTVLTRAKRFLRADRITRCCHLWRCQTKPHTKNRRSHKPPAKPAQPSSHILRHYPSQTRHKRPHAPPKRPQSLSHKPLPRAPRSNRRQAPIAKDGQNVIFPGKPCLILATIRGHPLACQKMTARKATPLMTITIHILACIAFLVTTFVAQIALFGIGVAFGAFVVSCLGGAAFAIVTSFFVKGD